MSRHGTVILNAGCGGSGPGGVGRADRGLLHAGPLPAGEADVVKDGATGRKVRGIAVRLITPLDRGLVPSQKARADQLNAAD